MKLLTIAEAAAIAAISPKQLRRLVNDGSIAAVRFGASARADRILLEELESFIRDNNVRAPQTCQLLKPSKEPTKLTSPLTESELLKLLKNAKPLKNLRRKPAQNL